MEYISTKEAAERWGVKPRFVQQLLHENRIAGAKRYGNYWLIPANAEKPLDPRKARKLARPAQPIAPRSLPRACPLLAMTNLCQHPENADSSLLSLTDVPNAHALFEAQLCYFRGEPDKAAALSKTLLAQDPCFDARLGCQLNIANAALYTGDTAAWQKARKAIAQVSCQTEAEQAMRDFCLAVVDSALYDRRSYPEWLKIGCFDPLPIDAFPAARYYFARYLAISRASFDTVRMLEPLCAQSRAEGAIIAEIYLRLVAVVGYHDGGDSARAAFHLERVLDIALPDRLYAPLAEARRNVGAMLDTALKKRDEAALRKVIALEERLLPSWSKLYQEQMSRPFAVDLTLRENEAAKYAALGMTNEEIAEKMQLSVNTIRSYIGIALLKTGLKDRNEFLSYLSLS